MRRVIIVREGRPVGSISRTSLLRWFSNWVLSIEPPDESDADASRSNSSSRAGDAIERLAARAQRLAENFWAWEAGGMLHDEELHGPLISDISVDA